MKFICCTAVVPKNSSRLSSYVLLTEVKNYSKSHKEGKDDAGKNSDN